MRYLLCAATILCLMTACSTEPDSPHKPVRVEIEKTDDGYRLLRGGEPYTVRGAGMVIDDLERFAASGGNSVRNWSTTHDGQETGAFLDAAQQHGVTVALG